MKKEINQSTSFSGSVKCISHVSGLLVPGRRAPRGNGRSTNARGGGLQSSAARRARAEARAPTMGSSRICRGVWRPRSCPARCAARPRPQGRHRGGGPCNGRSGAGAVRASRAGELASVRASRATGMDGCALDARGPRALVAALLRAVRLRAHPPRASRARGRLVQAPCSRAAAPRGRLVQAPGSRAVAPSAGADACVPSRAWICTR